MPPRNLVNLKDVTKGFAARTILEDVTLGVAEGERIGVVGINGDGKSTLLKLIAGTETPDSGDVTRTGGLDLAILAQGDDLDPEQTVRQELIGGRADHEWQADASFRDVLDGLLGGVSITRFEHGLDTQIEGLSGGERRRIALAKLLLGSPELLLLDEPTNHLDIEGVNWLAQHLAARKGTLLVVTHDRWFLDAVVEQTWEVGGRTVRQYEGGYAAYVLAKAERDRIDHVREERRQMLVRKELAWLRRGPPARTSKPKFRIEAANQLIENEPPVRDGVQLLRFATARLGDKVVEAEEVSVAYGDKVLLDRATWRLGPGDRVGLVGVNGAGKTTLINLLSGETTPDDGRVVRGATVQLAQLSQDTVEVPGNLRVLEALEAVRVRTKTSEGQELTAGQLAERFGFKGEKGRTLVKDLSGGERRRLQLMRLLMTEPNVLVLDEPTNDLDIDTLTALEDLLDAWPGTLIVVSHDRYFVERVTDDVYALMGDGKIRHLPGGLDEYLRLRHARERATAAPAKAVARANGQLNQAVVRAARKEVARLERTMAKLDERETVLHESMAGAATDFDRLRELQTALESVTAERDELELAWLEASETAEG